MYGTEIPEWLRIKMGVQNEKTISDSDPDDEVQILREEINRLQNVVSRSRADCIRNLEFCDGGRGEDRC